MMIDYSKSWETIKFFIEVGHRIKKVPWCCDGNIEGFVADELFSYGIREHETMEESLNRHELEKEKL